MTMGKTVDAINSVTVAVDSSISPTATRIKDALKELVLAFDSQATTADSMAALIAQVADVYGSGGGGGGSAFDVSQATGVSFQGSTASAIDLSGLDTSNFTSMLSMFAYCSNLTSVDLSGFSTGNVTSFAHMFNGCSSLKQLDISSFDTSKAAGLTNFIKDCTALESFVTGENWTQAAASSANKAKFPVAMTDENETAFAVDAVIPNGAHTYTAVGNG